MIKALGILGSPKKAGNADILLKEALKGAASCGAKTEKICLGDLEFKGCIECNGCDKTGVCVLEDDMTPIYDKIKTADAVILASPIFFASVTAQLKAMIDRCQSEWVAKYILKKRNQKPETSPPWPDIPAGRGNQRQRKGAFICVSGHKKDTFFKVAKKTIDVFFRTMDVDFSDELFVGGVDKLGEVKNVKGALEKAYILGRKIVKK